MTSPDVPTIGILVGSTRPGRRSPVVAAWVEQVARQHPGIATGGADLRVIDLADHPLPFLDEPLPARWGKYSHEHTARWSAVVAALDAVIVVCPEYNHSVPAVLKNAIDHLYAEWTGTVVGLVGFGAHGGTRAIDHLRQVFAEVGAAVVPAETSLAILEDFDFTGFDMTDPTSAGVVAPRPGREETLVKVLDQVLTWTRALNEAPVRV